MKRVLYTPAAARDLITIGDFIARDSSQNAQRFVAQLRAACRSLATESSRYPILAPWQNIHRMPVGNYVVLYRIAIDRVQVIRVLHSARDIGDLVLN